MRRPALGIEPSSVSLISNLLDSLLPKEAVLVMTPFPFCAVAAVCPALLTLVSPISVATIADAMRSMDVLALYVSASRATGLPTRTFPFPSHVTLTVLVCVMAARLDSSLSCLCFLAYASYSSSVVTTRLSQFFLHPYVPQTIKQQ